MKLLKIRFEDWDHTCGDGCCYTYGTNLYLNDKKLGVYDASDSESALIAVLEELGYEVEMEY